MHCSRHVLRSFLIGKTQPLSVRFASAGICEAIQSELSAMKVEGTLKRERIIAGQQAVRIRVEGQNKPLLNFCANNYLGLSNNPEAIAAGQRVLETHGAGVSSVRFICGTQDIHRQLERKIAQFHGRDDAILYAACFDANAGFFEVMLNNEDAILSDELNHASIIDGIRLCKAKRFPYKHKDMGDLESKLKESQGCRRRIIATDGCFSMDGNIAPLKEICQLADQYKALVFIDECHATGFLGQTGRGTEEHLGIDGQVDVINSTLGKALGGAMGGYTTGPQPIIDLLRQRSRPYLFSNSLAPAVVGSSLKVVEMLMEKPLAGALRSKVSLFRERMRAAGFTVSGDPEHPICPVMIGDASLATQLSEKMLARGIYVIGFSYPVVPKGKARVRVQISAAHSEDDISTCIEAFIQAGKELNII